jgi:hypothetical protein
MNIIEEKIFCLCYECWTHYAYREDPVLNLKYFVNYQKLSYVVEIFKGV